MSDLLLIGDVFVPNLPVVRVVENVEDNFGIDVGEVSLYFDHFKVALRTIILLSKTRRRPTDTKNTLFVST